MQSGKKKNQFYFYIPSIRTLNEKNTIYKSIKIQNT